MEENFESLLEEYLTEDDFNEYAIEEDKQKLDETRSGSKLNYGDENTISIYKYVNEYLGIKGDCKNLFHSGLKELESPFVVGVSHDYANKNPEYVYKGYLLLVSDVRNNKGTYINPNMINIYLNRDIVFKKFKRLCKNGVNGFEHLEEYNREYNNMKVQIDRINTMHMILYETHKLREINRLYENNEKGKSL